MPEHWQPWQGDHHRTYPKVLVFLAELVHSGPFVRVVHEIYIPFEDLGIKLECVFHDQSILGVFLVAEHIHEGAVINTVHPEGTDEITFH